MNEDIIIEIEKMIDEIHGHLSVQDVKLNHIINLISYLDYCSKEEKTYSETTQELTEENVVPDISISI